jgi:hypothetical protein
VNKEKKVWAGLLGGGGAVALGLGALLYTQSGELDEMRLEADGLRTQVTQQRKLIEGTAALEREVIVQRELSQVIRNILPDEEDMNNWARTIQSFSEESGVRVRGLKKQAAPPNRGRKQDASAFDEVTYAFSLEADAFQLLDFLDLVENHKRFMRVPSLKINAARRESVEESGFAAHKVSVDLQTFVYEPKKEAAQVKIEGYDRKRDLMLGEINRRRQGLEFASYEYRGTRGRRDPFVDPRVPVEGGSVLSVPEQMEIVQGLVDQMDRVQRLFQSVRAAENVIEEMMARADLEDALARLEEEVRRVEAEGGITYLPSQRRMQLEVTDAITALRAELGQAAGPSGPSVEKLREVLEAMNRHFEREEYELALDAFRVVADQLDFVEADPLRRPFVEKLRHKAGVARIVREFESIRLEVDGVAIMEGAPAAALINGQSLGEGDMLGNELLINEIRTDEIEFIYRGIVLARRF